MCPCFLEQHKPTWENTPHDVIIFTAVDIFCSFQLYLLNKLHPGVSLWLVWMRTTKYNAMPWMCASSYFTNSKLLKAREITRRWSWCSVKMNISNFEGKENKDKVLSLKCKTVAVMWYVSLPGIPQGRPTSPARFSSQKQKLTHFFVTSFYLSLPALVVEHQCLSRGAI